MSNPDEQFTAMARAQNRAQRDLEAAIERATIAPHAINELQIFGCGTRDLQDGRRAIIIAHPDGTQTIIPLGKRGYEKLGTELGAPHANEAGENSARSSTLELPK